MKQLNKNNLTTDVLTKADYAPDAQVNHFVKGVGFKVIRFKRYKIRFLTILHRIYLTILTLTRQEYKVIICSGEFSLWTGFLIKLIKRRYKSIAITHGGEINSSNNILRKITDKSLSSFDAIVSVSHYTQCKLPASILEGNKKLKVIPNGINLSEFNTGKIPKNDNATHYPNLLTVGALWERKGQQNVIKALPVIKKQFPLIYYHCVGYKLQEKRLIDLAEKLNVTNSVTFYGSVDRFILESFYKKADIFIMLSANTKSGDFEGFGIAVLEANMFGKPAIGSKNSGISDAIVDGETGYLVDPDSPDEIANAIAKTLENYDYLAKNAKKFAQKHSWENITEEYIRLVEEVL